MNDSTPFESGVSPSFTTPFWTSANSASESGFGESGFSCSAGTPCEVCTVPEYPFCGCAIPAMRNSCSSVIESICSGV